MIFDDILNLLHFILKLITLSLAARYSNGQNLQVIPELLYVINSIF